MTLADLHIEDIQVGEVHSALEGVARSALEPLDQEDTVQEGMVPDAQDPVVVLEEAADLGAAEPVDSHLSHLLEAQEVHEEILDCSIVQNHVPRTVGIVDAERVVLQSRPS